MFLATRRNYEIKRQRPLLSFFDIPEDNHTVHSLTVLRSVLVNVKAKLKAVDAVFELNKILTQREVFLFSELLCIETDIDLLSILIETFDPDNKLGT